MLSSVVLPAPLGPMTETMSPLATSTLTCWTACTPPKAFDTSRTSSSALIETQHLSELSRQPPFAAAVVLHVAVALALADARQTQVELLDVLVVADGLRIPVEHDTPRLHDVAVLGKAQRDRRVLLGEQHCHPLL